MKKLIKEIYCDQDSLLDKEITIEGWVKTIRIQKTFAFIEINDGTFLKNLQIIVDKGIKNFDKINDLSPGASASFTGLLVKSPGQNQSIELQAKSFSIIGLSPIESYPLQKKRHSFEFLRTIAHLRCRTNTQGAILRIKNALSFATHLFFQKNNFIYIQTPIITSSDCEGGGDLFQITTPSFLNKMKGKEKMDFSQDFFSQKAYLTVSGQLNAEAIACGCSKVYTFGPAFRAENSNTSRHLAELWMIEPEMAFADLKDNMDNAENYIKYVIQYVFDNCYEDLQFFDKFIEKNLIQRLKNTLETSFERLTYTEAIKILEKSNKSFEFPHTWGSDLQSEHERYITEQYFKKPVILINYPKSIKSFYMRLNDDNKTVAAMDVLVPNIGEIIGGSQREERLDILIDRIKESKLNEKDYWWYIDLRKYGSVPHSGYGVGFERLTQFITGIENIRDISTFPRYTKHVNF